MIVWIRNTFLKYQIQVSAKKTFFTILGMLAWLQYRHKVDLDASLYVAHPESFKFAGAAISIGMDYIR